jgi:hypothetical protein
MIICQDSFLRRNLTSYKKKELKFTAGNLQTTKVLHIAWFRTSSKSNVVTSIVANREAATTAVIPETEEAMKE